MTRRNAASDGAFHWDAPRGGVLDTVARMTQPRQRGGAPSPAAAALTRPDAARLSDPRIVISR